MRCVSLEKEVDYAELGKKIKEVRLNKKITQEKLAEMVGCNTSHISNIENNYTKLSLNVLLAIANSLDVSIDYLLSNQYTDPASALDNEILRAVRNCSIEKKGRILKMIEIL